MGRRQTSGFAFGVMVAVAAAGIMMILTGAVWQFIPVVLAIVVVLGVAKAL